MRQLVRAARPWWGMVLLWACLNPQPDTSPLATPVTTTVVPPSQSTPMPSEDSSPAGAQGAAPAADGDSPSTEPAGPEKLSPDDRAPEAPDAGAAAPDAGPQRTPVTFSTRDAGVLAPDAGASEPAGD